jgi:hypothetical protein
MCTKMGSSIKNRKIIQIGSWMSLYCLESRDLFTKVSTRLEDPTIFFITNMGGNVISGLDLHRTRGAI